MKKKINKTVMIDCYAFHLYVSLYILFTSRIKSNIEQIKIYQHKPLGLKYNFSMVICQFYSIHRCKYCENLNVSTCTVRYEKWQFICIRLFQCFEMVEMVKIVLKIK